MFIEKKYFFSIVFEEFFERIRIVLQFGNFQKTKFKLSGVFEMIFLLLFRGDNLLNLPILKFFCSQF
jgi:hypothetical protein